MENWKKIVLLIVILVLVIAFDLLLYFKTDKLVEEIQSMLAELENFIDEDNLEKSKEQAKKLKEKWENAENTLSFFIEHEEVEKVSLKIEIIKENIENKEEESALEDIAEANRLLEHIQDKYNFTLKNVF